MATKIVPLAPEHLEPAAALLAARHRADRTREPDLPARFEDASMAREALRAALERDGSTGVVALRDDHLVGYLLGAPAFFPPTVVAAQFFRPRAAVVPYEGHAVDPDLGEDSARELHRALYASLAARWIAAGCFAHYAWVPAADQGALATWGTLGFGQDLALAARDTAAAIEASPAPDIEVRQPTADDAEALVGFGEALMRYQANAPIFLPSPPETVPACRQRIREILADSNHAHWLACRDGRPVGMHLFGAAGGSAGPAMATPDRAVHLTMGYTAPEARGSGVGGALLARSMTWARDAGYERCVLGFLTANLVAARFWQGQGFRPLVYRLCRQVDERIAWARGDA